MMSLGVFRWTWAGDAMHMAAIVIGCKMAEGGPFLKMLLSPCV